MKSQFKRIFVSTLISGGLLHGACGAKEEPTSGGNAAPAPAENQAAAKKTTLDGLLPTKAPARFGPLEKLEFGMTAEEAGKALPDMFKGKYPRLDSDTHEGVGFSVYIPKDSGVVATMQATLANEKALEIVKAAWGEPMIGTDLGNDMLRWFNPELGIAATAKTSYPGELGLDLHHYVPMTTFIGAGQGLPFGFEATRPMLGATAEELKAAYPKAFVSVSQEEADAQRKGAEKMAGRDLSALGKARPSVHLDFPPTEWGSYFTRVNLDWTDDGKVAGYSFGISFKPFPAARDAIHDALKARFGEPQPGERYGRPLFVYSENPRVTAEDNKITKNVDVTVKAPE